MYGKYVKSLLGMERIISYMCSFESAFSGTAGRGRGRQRRRLGNSIERLSCQCKMHR